MYLKDEFMFIRKSEGSDYREINQLYKEHEIDDELMLLSQVFSIAKKKNNEIF